MRILYFYQYFCTPQGSWSTRVYEFARRWVRAGHEVTVVTAPYEKTDIKAKGLVKTLSIEGIKVIVINSGDSNRISFFGRSVRAIVFAFISTFISVFIKKDIIIASSGPITIGIPGIISSLISQKPLIFEVRDLWPDGAIEMGIIRGKTKIKISKLFEKLCYKYSSLVVPCSPGMEYSIKSGFKNINTLVIPNSSDIGFFENSNNEQNKIIADITKGRKLLLYAGSMGLMDACDEIIKGLIFLKDRNDYIMIFLGEGVEKANLIKLATELELSEKVFFMGLLPKNIVAAWVQNAYVSFVAFKNYPVLSTSSPNKMFDSFAAGVPVIQNTRGWIKELFETKKCGLNAVPGNSESMAHCIQTLLDDENYRNELGRNAKELAMKNFNRDILAEEFLQNILKIKYNSQ